MIFARYVSVNKFFYLGEGLTRELALEDLQENYNNFEVETGPMDPEKITFWEATKIPSRVIMKLSVEDA